MRTRQSGFVALLSVIIIGAILTIYVFTLGISSFFSRFSALDSEQKVSSRTLAEACISVAIGNIARDVIYAPPSGGQCVSVTRSCGTSDPNGTCKICAVSYMSGVATIDVRAMSSGAYTDLRTVVDLSHDFAILGREETPLSEISTCSLP